MQAASSVPAPLLSGCAHEPLTIVDVGARGGLQPHWRPLARHITWIGFEPDARSVDALPHDDGPARTHVLNVALSDRKGRVTLHRTRDEGDSSLLRPNRAFLADFERPERFDIVDTVDLDADTLDAQLDAIDVRRVDVLKLDTQGTELAILRGSTGTLARGLLAVDVEVEFSPLYEEQPLFAEVDRFLRGYDLQLVDLAPRRSVYAAGARLALARGTLVWAEALYLPTLDRTTGEIAVLPVDARAARLAKACLVAVAYGLPDRAMALVDRAAPLVSSEDAQALRDAVAAWDTAADGPRVPVTVGLRPAEMRALQASRARTGMKPTQQIRKLIQQWAKGAPDLP